VTLPDAADPVFSVSGDGPLLATLLAAAVLEEIVFRLGLHEALLRRWSANGASFLPSRANVATALAFAIAHLLTRGAWLAVGTFPIAIGIGLLYERQRKVLPCIGLHALLNLLWWGIAAQ